MRYIKNGVCLTIEEVRQQNPNMGIPDNANIPEMGYFKLIETIAPTPLANHTLVESYELVEGVWTTVYTQVPLSLEEINAAKKARVPKSITMRQARLALLFSGLLGTVEVFIAGMTGDAGKAAQIEWDYSSEVWRDKQLVATLGPQLGLTDDQLDDLFIFARTIL